MTDHKQQDLPVDLIRPSRAAKILNVCMATVYRLILRGKVRSWRTASGRYQVSESEVRGLLVEATPGRAPAVATPRQQQRGENRAREFLRQRGYRY